MAVEIYANQPSTTVSSGGTDAPASGTPETWTVASSSSFPAASSTASPPTQFHIIDTATGKTSEIIAVTNVSGATWTVTRGAESTTPVAHSAGFTVTQVVTEGGLAALAVTGGDLAAVAGGFSQVTSTHLGSALPVNQGGTGATSAGSWPTLNQNTTGNAATATTAAGLTSATTTVAVSAATAPSSGQVLTATSGTAAGWQAPGGGYQAWQFPAGAPSGSDDTTAIQAAINSAATYAVANNYFAEIVFQPGVYLVEGALKHGTPTFGYSQLTLPVVPISGNPTMVLRFTGTRCNSGPPMFTAGGDTPAAGTEGTVLRTTLTGQAYSGLLGYPCILGAPTPEQGYSGGFTNLWNNLMPVIDGITFMAPLNPSMTGVDIRSCVKTEIPWGRALANGTMAQMAAQDPSTGGATGILVPQGGNNAHNVIGAWTSAGFQTGLVLYENTSFEQISTFYCDDGLVADYKNAGHGIAGTLYIAGGNNTHLQVLQDSSPTFLFPLDIVEMQCENASQYSAGFYIDDGNNGVGGRIGLSTSEALSNVSVRGASNLEIILGSTAGGGGGGDRSVQSAPTYTLGTAFQNPWWRHQWVTLNSGTTTGILIGSTSATCTTSVGTTTASPVSFRLPTGWWLNIQGSIKPSVFTAVPD